MVDRQHEPGKAWAGDRMRGSAAVADDGRPRPRLVWSNYMPQRWLLLCGEARVGYIANLGAPPTWRAADGVQQHETEHGSAKDAMINLRLRFIAAGFDVVPAEILGSRE